MSERAERRPRGGSGRLLVVIVSDDGRAEIGLRMAARMVERRALADVRVLFFGPGERLLAERPAGLADSLKTIEADGPAMACRGFAEELGVLREVAASGAELVAAGQEIERRILDGYQVMTF